jgi:hypothetical protein
MINGITEGEWNWTGLTRFTGLEKAGEFHMRDRRQAV